MLFALTGARIFTGETWLDDFVVVVEGGRIADVLPAEVLPEGVVAHALDGGILAPGFIDSQVNGGGGVMFNDDPSREGLEAILAAHRRHGTTGLLATLISDSDEVMAAAAAAVCKALNDGMPGLLGIHFEGPYLNVDRRGAHDRGKIRPFDNDSVQRLTAVGAGTTLVTLAPEMIPRQGLRALVDAGLIVAAGHSMASYDDIRQALVAGLRGFTHLFNAMLPLQSREPGVVGAALEDAESWCGLIVDGHHVHPASMRLALAAKPTGKVMLTTDAMAAVGSSESSFEIAGEAIAVIDGACRMRDGTLAGSNLDMSAALRNAVAMLQVPLGEALRMASLYPAQYLKLDGNRGRISPGQMADMVWLDDELAVRETWIAGQDSGGDAPS